jgi:hypothetical protein
MAPIGGPFLLRTQSLRVPCLVFFSLALMALPLAAASPSLAEATAFSLEPKDLQQLVNQQVGVTTARW